MTGVLCNIVGIHACKYCQVLSSPHSDPLSNVALLTKEAVDGVEKFVVFASYSRSGSSIIGSMLDAHPNVIIAHEFYLFTKLKDNPDAFSNKWQLFNELYMNSYWSSIDGLRTTKADSKGYTLDVPGLYQGQLNGTLKMIGDKTGADTANYFDSRPWMFAPPYYKELTNIVGIPIYVIHVVRNPYDLIATSSTYLGDKRLEASETNKLHDPVRVKLQTRTVFRRAAAIQRIKSLDFPVLDMHLVDLVTKPKEAMQSLCDFLEIDCSETYLQRCRNKVFGSLSKTRKRVWWPRGLKEQVEEERKKYSFFSRYSFSAD